MANPISTVGSLATANTVNITTLSVSPTAVGNMLTAWAGVTFTTGSNHFTGISGGGVTSWTQITTGVTLSDLTAYMNMWFGPVTATGSSTITFTTSGSLSGVVCDLACQEFTSNGGSGTAWAVDGTQTGTITNASSTTTVTMPTLTPGASSRLYVGGFIAGYSSSSATSGYTVHDIGSSALGTLWNPSVSTAQSPTITTNNPWDSTALAALITATNPFGGVRSVMSNQSVKRAAYY